MRVRRSTSAPRAGRGIFAGLCVGTALLTIGATAGAVAFTGGLTSAGSTFAAGTLQLEGATGTAGCYSTGTGSGGAVSSNSTVCATGSPVPSGSLSATTAAAATTVLRSTGTTTATTASVSSATCGVGQFADSRSATDWSGTGPDTALPLFGVSYQASGPLGGAAATTDGSTGWAETTTAYTNPQGFTLLAWFRTTSASGSILGFSNDQTAPRSAGNYDRMLWIDPAGHVVWGVYNGSTHEATSSSSYADGAWHFVAASIGGRGQKLFVDGAQVGSTTAKTAQSGFTGWWSIGLSGVLHGGWPDPPTGAYFDGALAQIAVIPMQLTAPQLSALYASPTLASYASGVTSYSPVDDWALDDPGTVPYTGPVPGGPTSASLVDASGNADTGTATGGVTLAAGGPPTLGPGARAAAFDGSTGSVQTAVPYADPQGISEVAWFQATGTSGGTVLGFTDQQSTVAPGTWDRTVWLDDAGHLVYGTYNGATQEVTSPAAYNDGRWHLVVAEVGPAGQQLWVDGTEVAANAAFTTAQNYTGYWHVGWGVEDSWPDAPSVRNLNGSLSEVAVVPGQLTAGQVSTLFGAGGTASLATDIGGFAPMSYWPIQDAASGSCGTTELTVQQAVGSTVSCVYPAGPGACPAPAPADPLTGLGTRTLTAPSPGAPVTVTLTLRLTAPSGPGLSGLHELAGIAFGATRSSTPWSAQISYPAAEVQL